jgi:hypothetical protein
MQQLHKDNHYVPQVYLKQWAGEGVIPTYSLLVPHHKVPLWKLHSLKGIAFHQHLYTQMVGGAETDSLERWLDEEFEAPAERAITRAVTDQRLNPDEWEKLVRFAVAQDVRTPARLREFLHRQAQMMPSMLQNTLQDAVEKLAHDKLSVRPGKTSSSIGFPLKISVEDQKDGTATLKAETIVGRAMWHWSLRHLLTSSIEKMPHKGWSILRAASGCFWPTSDNPLIRLNYVDRQRYDFDGGWCVQNGDVLLPLSPTRLLHHCGGRRSFSHGHQLDQVTSSLVRRIIIEHADRYIFSKEEFDIHRIRERTVNLGLYKMERDAWKNWHLEQARAEDALI